VSMNYGYDIASQLTGITYALGPNTLGTLDYAYDPAGRRTSVGGSYARTSTPLAVSSASYNANNQLTNWKGTNLTYDANGNLTNDGTNTYTWNARNLLLSVSGSVSANFQYDAFGRRVSKTIGGTSQYLYDGANPVQEISGLSASANLLTGGVDEYFQRTDSTGARNSLTDALSSTVALSDSTGALQTQYTFEPFGNTSVAGASTTNSLDYTGRELDPTGLYFYRARYYVPQMQRFISEDPLGFGANSVNFYEYVYDSPTSFTDPSGMQEVWIDPELLDDLIDQIKEANGGRSRVKLPDGRHVDVDGEDHFNKELGEDVPTPHTRFPRINESPTGPRVGYPNNSTFGNPWPWTLQDLPDALKFLEPTVLINAIGCLTGRKSDCHFVWPPYRNPLFPSRNLPMA
jgi:RHS repeat-associated protein